MSTIYSEHEFARATVFDKLPGGEWPWAKVYEGGHVFAFMDASQLNVGHAMVASKLPLELPTARREHAVKRLGFHAIAKAG